jgi:hypothetical protein
MKLRRVGLAVAVLALVATAAQSSAAAAPGHHGTNHMSALRWDAGVRSRPDIRFTVTAPPVRGLYPGAVVPMRLTVHNPQSYPIRITGIGARLTATSKRACLPVPANLSVGARTGRPDLPIVVPPHGSRGAGQIALSMPNTVTDACQFATFTIHFDGTAEKVRR